MYFAKEIAVLGSLGTGDVSSLVGTRHVFIVGCKHWGGCKIATGANNVSRMEYKRRGEKF